MSVTKVELEPEARASLIATVAFAEGLKEGFSRGIDSMLSEKLKEIAAKAAQEAKDATSPT